MVYIVFAVTLLYADDCVIRSSLLPAYVTCSGQRALARLVGRYRAFSLLALTAQMLMQWYVAAAITHQFTLLLYL
jgi:hypothetical protein